jgi:hypothetical protein
MGVDSMVGEGYTRLMHSDGTGEKAMPPHYEIKGLTHQASIDDETLAPVYTAEIRELEDRLWKARLIQNDILRRLIKQHGVVKTAEIAELGIFAVRGVRGPAQPRSNRWPAEVID